MKKKPVIPPGRAPSGKSRRIPDDSAAKAAAEMGEALRMAYMNERRSYESAIIGTVSEYRTSRRSSGHSSTFAEHPESRTPRNIWENVATVLHERRIDPCDYVRVIFACIGSAMQPPPMPEQLLSAQWMTFFKAHARMLLDDIQTAFVVQKQIASTEFIVVKSRERCSTIRATVAVILNESIGLSALFRYCLAHSMEKPERFGRCMDYYKVPAAVQYIRCAEFYDKVWGEWIPKNFKKEASVIYSRIIDADARN